MRIDGGGGGFFVGLNPAAAQALVTTLRGTAAVTGARGTRITALLDEAGADAGGAATGHVLNRLRSWLEAGGDDLLWRMAMLEATPLTGGMALGVLSFSSAAAARSAGGAYGVRLRNALRAYLDAEGDEAEEAALQRYLGMVRATSIFADDPAWSGGLVDALGRDGVWNALSFSARAVEGEVDETRGYVGPLAAALATSLRHRTSQPQIRRDLLDLPVWDLGLLLAMAPAETGFLVSAARRMFVTAQRTPEFDDDPTDREYVFVLEALAENAEASYEFLTGPAPAYEPIVARMLRPVGVLTNPDAAVAAAQVLEQGLVVYPAGRDSLTWNRAVSATEDAIGFLAEVNHQLKWVPPQVNATLAGLLRPHLDAVAVIGADSAGVDDLGYDLARDPGSWRSPLDVDTGTLREFLGGVMQQDSGVAHLQILLGAYSQSPSIQAHRLPLIDGDVADLEPFIVDSLRVAGFAGIVGQGLDIAGHDEESRTRLLTGAFKFATGQGTKLIPSATPAQWLAQQGAKYAAGKAVEEFSDWVASFEPLEGEEGVDAFIDSYVATTEVGLRDHMATDPQLVALPSGERERRLQIAMALVQGQVGEGLRPVYAGLVGETEGER